MRGFWLFFIFLIPNVFLWNPLSSSAVEKPFSAQKKAELIQKATEIIETGTIAQKVQVTFLNPAELAAAQANPAELLRFKKRLLRQSVLSQLETVLSEPAFQKSSFQIIENDSSLNALPELHEAVEISRALFGPLDFSGLYWALGEAQQVSRAEHLERGSRLHAMVWSPRGTRQFYSAKGLLVAIPSGAVAEVFSALGLPKDILIIDAIEFAKLSPVERKVILIHELWHIRQGQRGGWAYTVLSADHLPPELEVSDPLLRLELDQDYRSQRWVTEFRREVESVFKEQGLPSSRARLHAEKVVEGHLPKDLELIREYFLSPHELEALAAELEYRRSLSPDGTLDLKAEIARLPRRLLLNGRTVSAPRVPGFEERMIALLGQGPEGLAHRFRQIDCSVAFMPWL